MEAAPQVAHTEAPRAATAEAAAAVAAQVDTKLKISVGDTLTTHPQRNNAI